MAHHTMRDDYSKLVNRLNAFPQGAPPSKLLFKILSLLFSSREAELVALLPIKPFTPSAAAQAWKLSICETRKILNELADRAILVDAEMEDDIYYTLPPPMAGFFEFSLMRVDGNIDQRYLSELFYEYINVEEDFIKQLFTDGETQMGRIFVHEPVLTGEHALHVLGFERASEVIKKAFTVAVGACYCRHKMEHIGRACDAPMNVCMTFDYTGDSLIRHSHARRIEAAEALDLLQQSYEHNLVQFGENVQNGVHFICNCCKCCCDAMLAAKRFGFLRPVHTSSFLPLVSVENCLSCAKCTNVCPVDAISIPETEANTCAVVDEERCLGCGVCVRVCPANALSLKKRKEEILTPVNTTHRVVSMAIERGKLQNLMFDNQVLTSHRALAAMFGVIFKLPPVKRLLANVQIKSRYLGRLIEAFS